MILKESKYIQKLLEDTNKMSFLKKIFYYIFTGYVEIKWKVTKMIIFLKIKLYFRKRHYACKNINNNKSFSISTVEFKPY